ncbi:hypothetical protein QFC22_002757 [Naganishia vaughanmartiniae]|uniref:Uncharacterized protein n=1 Tax=Naganishia vaughanmartiniae TaxID=1424756 RepID=A0ACC2XAL2_9TREE|nr:hypothetical protein QFC22_002757 [Naganishia vaughanmartiniae]
MANPHSESAKDTSSEEVSEFDEQMSDSFTDDESSLASREEIEEDEEEMQDEEFPTLIEPNGKRYYTWGIVIVHPDVDTAPRGKRTRARKQVNLMAYTIRLDAIHFDAGKDKKMRYLLNRWKRFVLEGNKPGDQESKAQQPAEKTKGKQKATRSASKMNVAFDYTQELHATEHDVATAAGVNPSVRYEVYLVPAAATTERFTLVRILTAHIHAAFTDSHLSNPPLVHRVDGELIAFSVLDILPGCVSSVYFVWDPDYAWASLGKLSALREAALAKEFHKAGMTDMGWLYMGFYIWTCQKMRYKGEYSPSYLLDPLRPQGYTPFDTDVATLARTRKDEGSMADTAKPIMKSGIPPSWPTPPPPSFLSPDQITKNDLRRLVVLLHGSLTLLGTIPFRNPSAVNRLVAELIAALGKDRLATVDTLERRIFLTF